ncbi:hypothetical protein N780_09595 [Pontibacillus chungwhensis BH030062]|uniref:Lipoprotein n=1 Tax=Pontibacillus chungwhensis BH030062 TaxID=1385513 RepID=A0A0A2UPP2_9BACI|nr:hypothetical protein [Pontibacillus chungwhensis]KGP89884.1 hypothetical protein N780_09595 [Pontibacillus chungwhensis BH030062]
MSVSKNWLAMLVVISALMILGACGNEEANSEEAPVQDGQQDSSPKELMAMSEGLKEYSVWFRTSNNPSRNSNVSDVYIFGDGEVKRYSNFSDLSIEEIYELSDEDIIQYVSENAESRKEGKFTLDISLDQLGQNTEEMNVALASGKSVRTFDLEAAASEHYHTYYGEGSGEFFDKYPEFNTYLSAVKNGEVELPKNSDAQTNEIDGDKVIATQPIEDGNLVTFQPNITHQTIFDTTFSGLKVSDNYSLLTRVNSSFVGFKVDDPDTKSKNVTVEGE